ncbi:MAG: aspartate kinase [Oscillospiraceae bacterium]|nr:aspartate kinase [Oscillospiraceae bacterium]
MKLEVSENVSAVSFNNVPLNKTIMEDTLRIVAGAGINVDMISMTAPTSEIFSFGFTMSDDDMPKLVGLVKKLKEMGGVSPMINGSNRKIVIKTGEMTETIGFAARVFEILNRLDAMILMITTGVDEISVLIRDADADAVVDAFEKEFK